MPAEMTKPWPNQFCWVHHWGIDTRILFEVFVTALHPHLCICILMVALWYHFPTDTASLLFRIKIVCISLSIAATELCHSPGWGNSYSIVLKDSGIQQCFYLFQEIGHDYPHILIVHETCILSLAHFQRSVQITKYMTIQWILTVNA